MRYEENPFDILHVSMRDSQEKILDKVEELSLTLDENLCSQASSILTNPTKRLEAEISWFPGYTPKKVRDTIERAKEEPDEFIDELSEGELNYADVNAEILALLNISYPKLFSTYLTKVACDLENIDVEALFDELNKERVAAKIPTIPDIDVLNKALKNRQNELAEIIYSLIKGFGQDKMIEILTDAIEESTDLGELEAEQLILQLIEKYEVDIQSSLDEAASKVEQQINFISESSDTGISDDELNNSIDLLEAQLKAWDRLAQPIQVSMQSQGLEHSASTDLAYSVRSIAIKLYNEHGKLEAAKRLIKLMQAIFAEVLTVAEKTDEDINILSNISSRDVLVSRTFKECDKYVEEAKSYPEKGYKIANEILSKVSVKLKSEETNSAESVLKDEILDIYINAALACIIQWGNRTKKWDESHSFIKSLLKYAKNKKTIERLNENLRILHGNVIAKSDSKSKSLGKFGCFGVIVIIFLLFFIAGINSTPSKSPTPASKQQTSQRQSSGPKDTHRQKSESEKAPTPRKRISTKYDIEHPYLNDGGLCEITIDNKNSFMPVYVRIWDMEKEKPVRAFYIRQGDSFTAKQLIPGKYEVRYRELYEGDMPSYGYKSEPFFLEQRRTPTGTEYSTFSLTLYKVRNGNARTERINVDGV